ncbi:UNVERIFIED_CONTAM: hypothetical protein GTU68_033107 [Idotea baltica]|nr:hypothetical protein [Idotea baltica]
MENFVDYVKLCARSGKGGAGSSHFHRDLLTSKGGPDGGDGGRGGHIIIRGNSNFWTLLHLKYRKHVIAKPGMGGSASRSSGAQGEDIYLEVPLGTVAKDFETGETLIEILENGQEYILAKGGRGGQGNAHYKSSTNQSPRYAQPGEDGLEEWKVLELKVLADVGLVGFPNAGKSTLLASITAAKPKIANYEFTTIKPNLGIVPYRNHRSFVMADIPGIIENAHLGKGLGHRFLRHIERNSVLLFMIPADSDNIIEQYNVLLNECEQFNPELMLKDRVLALTKCDLIDDEIKEWVLEELKNMPHELPTVFISSVAEKGLTELKDVLWKTITEE